jgi:hypothetical protein
VSSLAVLDEYRRLGIGRELMEILHLQVSEWRHDEHMHQYPLRVRGGVSYSVHACISAFQPHEPCPYLLTVGSSALLRLIPDTTPSSDVLVPEPTNSSHRNTMYTQMRFRYNVDSSTLHVRCSNRAAQKLYAQSLGYRIVETVHNYYQDGVSGPVMLLLSIV